MAEEFTLEGLNESQLNAYNEYLKLPNFTKEIAFDLVTDKIDAKEAGNLIFEGSLKVTPEKGSTAESDAMNFGVSHDSIKEGLQLTYDILERNKLLDSKEINLPDGKIVIPDEGVDAVGEPLKVKKHTPTIDEQKEFATYLPYKVKLLLNGFKIDDGAPDGVRWRLQFSPEDLQYQMANFKSLMVENYVETGKFTQSDYLKNTSNFQVEMKKLEPFDKEVMAYRVLPELGGDGIWRSINPPGFDAGDVKSFTSTTGLEIISTTTAYIIGNGLGFFRGQPIHSGAIAAGAMRYVHEVANELVGKHFIKLPYTKSLEDIMYANIPEGVIEYLGAGFIMKTLQKASKFVQASNEKMNVGKILETVKDYKGGNPKVTKILEDAKKMLTEKYDVSPEDAANYLATSMALQFPELVIGYTSKVSKKGIKKSIEDLIKKENIIFNVESQVVKKTVGADIRVIEDFKLLDDAMIKLIATDNNSKRYVLNANLALERDILKKFTGLTDSVPNVQYINSFAFPISELSAKLSAARATMNSTIRTIYNKPINKSGTNAELYKIHFGNNISLKKNMQTFKAILGGNPDKLIKQLQGIKPLRKDFVKGKDGDKLFNQEMAEYTIRLSNVENLGLNAFNTGHKILKNYLKMAKNEGGTLSYENASVLLNAVRDLESIALQGVQKNFLTKFKGVLNDSIRESVVNTNNKALIKAFDDLQHINYISQVSGVNDFARVFGFGTHQLSPTKVAATYEGSNVFYKFFTGSNAVRDSKILGTLLENNPYWKMNKAIPFQIRAASMEFYMNQVIKSGPLSQKMTHKEFMLAYGEQLESILGKKIFTKFKSSGIAAQTEYKNFLKNYETDMGIIQKYLQLDAELKHFTSEELGRAIMKQGNMLTLEPVIKAIGGVNSQSWKAVQRVIVADMFRNTSTLSPITNAHSFNGVLLAEYLHANSGILRKAFGNKFYQDHKLLAKALIVLQNNTKETMKRLGSLDASYKTLAEQTQTGGMMIDIFYGPLNHNRLIVNRLSRIYDKFDIDGVTHTYLNDYKLWINTAKKNFLSGQYPVILDKMSHGEKVRWAETIFKYHVGAETFIKPSILTLGGASEILNEVDLVDGDIDVMGYTIQKHGKKIPGEGTVAEGADVIWEAGKKQIKKDITDPIVDFVKKFMANLEKSKTSIKSPAQIEVEKKLEEMRGH